MKKRFIAVFFRILMFFCYSLSASAGALIVKGLQSGGEWWQLVIILTVGVLLGFIGYWCQLMSERVKNGYSFSLNIKTFLEKKRLKGAEIKTWTKKKWVITLVIVILFILLLLGITYSIYVITYQDCLSYGGNDEVEYISTNRVPRNHFEIFGCSLDVTYSEFAEHLKEIGFKQRPSTGHWWIGNFSDHETRIQITTCGKVYINSVIVQIYKNNNETDAELESMLHSIYGALVDKYGKHTSNDNWNTYWNLEEGNITLYMTQWYITISYDITEYEDLISDLKDMKKRKKELDFYKEAKSSF